MAIPHSALRHLPSSQRRRLTATPPSSHPAVKSPSDPKPVRSRAANRLYAVSWLGAQGHVGFETVMAPAIPLVESTCASVARGTLITTTQGDVAVEDLVPGMEIMTADYGPLPLRWIGSFDISPGTAQSPDQGRLFRITADSFGLSKPAQDLLLAPRAHMMIRHPGCQRLYGADQAFAPVRAYEDGNTVIGVTPRSSVTLFNLAFDRQAAILANGVELESFHPGIFAETLLDDDTLAALMRLFPYARSLDVFGPQVTRRLTAFEAQSLRVGG